MLILTKSLGSKPPLFADFSVPLPPDFDSGGGDDFALRRLIERVVRHEVVASQKRQSDRQFFRVLLASEIDDGVENGKIEMGESDIPAQNVDESQAVSTALIAF